MSDEQFGPYRLESVLGRGGMGEVFRAFDTEHERIVALKRLAPHLADDPQFRNRFKQEARVAARLRNPHIITIHRFGELDGHLFIDMRFVDGFDAADLVEAVGPLSPDRAVSLVEQVASALDTAHAAGLVHRDVKPSNLLIDREISHQLGDFVYLADFGITRSSSALRSYSLTRTGALLGSLDYMAPEQFDGVVDKRVDIYALTCVLFELLAGQKPYQAAGLPALMHAHLNVAPPAPSQFRPALGTGFDDVVRRGMAKRREERYECAGELAAAARRAAVISERAGHHGFEVGWNDRALRSFREAEYAYVAQHKKQEHTELRGRHVLNEDGSEADLYAVPTASGPSSRTGWPPVESDVTAPGGVDDGEPETMPVAVPEFGNGAKAPSASTIGAFSAWQENKGLGASHPRANDHGIPAPPGSPLASGGRSRRRVMVAVLAVVGVLVAVIAIGTWPSAEDRPGPLPGSDVAASAPQSPAESSRTPIAVPASTANPSVQAILPVGQAPQGLAVSPDSRRVLIANVDSRTLSIIDRGSGAASASLPMPGVPRYVAVSPDGRRAYVSMYGGDGADSAIAIVDTDSGAVGTSLASEPQPYALAVAATGDVYVPAHGAGSVSILDAQTLQFGASVPVEPNPHGVAFLPSGDRAYTANHESNSVSVIDLATNAVVATIAVGRSPHSLAVSPDGRLLAVANYLEATATLVDTGTNQVVATVPADATPQHLTFSADGAHLYIVNEEPNTVTTVDVAARAVVSTTTVGRSPRYIAAAPDGTTLYVSNSEDGTVSVLAAS